MNRWINELDPEQMRDVQALPAYHWFNGIDQWSVWCTFCTRWHTHGGLGHRAEHCHHGTAGTDIPRLSANYPDGYVLVDSGETITAERVAIYHERPRHNVTHNASRCA